MIYSTFGKIAGFYLSLLLSLGTHQSSVGIQAKTYIGNDFVQLNIGNSLSWNFYHLGKRRFFFENRLYSGICFMAGPSRSVVDFELDGLAHQTQKNYGLAFNYIVYSDNIGTSQLSGAFGLHFKNVSIRFENDIFGGQAHDRFRTGLLHVSWRTNEQKLGVGLDLWTGETQGAFWDKTARAKKMPYGYSSLEDLPYGKTSHGIIYASVHQRLSEQRNNVVAIKIGIDSEQIRHVFQNRLIHDLIFLPKNIERRTPHYPRLDKNGCPVFDKDSTRKSQIYLQTQFN